MSKKTILIFAILAWVIQACGSISTTTVPTNEPATNSPQSLPPSANGDLGLGDIRGRVVDGTSGAPIAGATVTCQQHTISPDASHLCNQQATTGQDGEFLFQNISFTDQDIITIHIEARGYAAINILQGYPSKAGIDMGDVKLSQASATEQPIPTGTSPMIANCQIFPPDNYWNTPIDNLPVDSHSKAWINSIGRDEPFHMDFGSGDWDGGPIGISYNVVAITQTNFVVPDFDYSDESDIGAYPIPTNPLIEWGNDHHLLLLDTDTCTLSEIYDASFDGTNWKGGSGAIWELSSNTLRQDTWTSADAAGLPILPGLVRYDEVAAGEIKHALRFTAEDTAGHIWPARHETSDPQNGIPPMGARFRLKADYDISSFPKEMQVILQAMKTYGIILADNGSNWYVSGAPDERWDNDMLHLLDVLTGSDFEAVDTSVLVVDGNSGEVKQ